MRLPAVGVCLAELGIGAEVHNRNVGGLGVGPEPRKHLVAGQAAHRSLVGLDGVPRKLEPIVKRRVTEALVAADRSDTGHAVGQLAEDIEVPVVPGGLLDQMEQDPTQRDGPTIDRPLGRGVQIQGGDQIPVASALRLNSSSSWAIGTATAMRISRSGSSSVHGPWSSSPSSMTWNQKYSTQRRWFTRPARVMSGEPGSGARRASASTRCSHLAWTVART